MIAASAAIILAASCASEQPEMPQADNVEIRLRADVGNMLLTRAAADIHNGHLDYVAGEGNDPDEVETIRVEILDAQVDQHGDANLLATPPVRIPYTFVSSSTAGDMAPVGTAPFFPRSGNKVNIYAYYPSTVTGTTTSFSVAVNQSDAAGYKASDLMYGVPSEPSANPVARPASGNVADVSLDFSHKLSKIIVNATGSSGISQIQEVRIVGGHRTVNITDAACTVGNTLSDALSSSGTYITAYSGGTTNTATCAAIIVPETALTGAFIELVTELGTATYSLNNKTFAGGMSYTYDITVTASMVGLTTAITDWDNESSDWVNDANGTASLVVPPDPIETVDIGLSVLWANMNVGAEHETDYGLYFMWGDVAGHPGVTTDGFSFDWSNYKWTTDGGSSFTKYTGSDLKPELEAADDAATANWGGDWRMPTKAEMEELADTYNTDANSGTHLWEWQEDYNGSGHNGYLITCKSNGNSLFLPAAGYRYNTSVGYQGSLGYYWSSALYSGYPLIAYYLYFNSGGANVFSYGDRCSGYAVRAVCDKSTTPDEGDGEEV